MILNSINTSDILFFSGLIYIYRGTCSLILWFKILSKTRGTINLCYVLILIYNEKFGQEHINYQDLFINSSKICYMDPS